MARYLLLALNGPTDGEGDEEAFNTWYDEVHLPDLLSIDGVRSARRYQVVTGNRMDWPYVAAYEIETDDVEAFMADLGTKPRPFTPAMDRTRSGFVLARQISD
ncbi:MULTISPECIES: hypothetical protein [unclassified Blastococcus]